MFETNSVKAESKMDKKKWTLPAHENMKRCCFVVKAKSTVFLQGVHRLCTTPLAMCFAWPKVYGPCKNMESYFCLEKLKIGNFVKIDELCQNEGL